MKLELAKEYEKLISEKAKDLNSLMQVAVGLGLTVNAEVINVLRLNGGVIPVVNVLTKIRPDDIEL